MVSVLGFSFSGSGQNAALAFVPLKPWDERKGARALGAGARRARLRRARRRSATRSSSRSCRRRSPSSAPRPASRSGSRTAAATATRRWSRRATSCSAWRRRARSSPASGPTASKTRRSCSVDIDRDRASALGVSFDNINAVLSTALGSTYVNDFPNAGRLQRVIVQADAPDRMQPDDLLQLNVVNNQGKPVPMAALATTRWITGPIQTIRFNGYPTMRISGDAAPGYSTGDAMDEMERLAGQLPAGFAFEWTGQSREERLSGSTAMILLAFSMLAVFLCLSALYESWSIPFAVLLAVPLGVLGAVLGATMRGMPNDVFFKVGLITVIGLSAKNAILIIEFAKDLRRAGQGRDRGDAAGGAPALPADPDDLDRLHPRRAAAGRLVGRRLGEPARDRHRRDGRDDHRDGAGDLLRAGVLRRRAPHLQEPGDDDGRDAARRRSGRRGAPLARDAGHA